MPRQKNTRPTSIYWLMDIRPETIAAGWLQGLPFYCGKTVKKPRHRLTAHRYNALHNPKGDVAPKMTECGQHVRIAVLEIVPPEGDWCTRERYWISESRRLFPDIMTNVADGGEGAPGWVPDEEWRAKIRAAHKRRKPISAETRERLSIAAKLRFSDPVERARCVEMNQRPRSEETLQKLRLAQLGKKHTPESLEKLRLSSTGRKHTPETVEKMRRQPFKESTRIKLSASKTGVKHSDETRAKLREVWKERRKKPIKDSTRAKLYAVWERRRALAGTQNA